LHIIVSLSYGPSPSKGQVVHDGTKYCGVAEIICHLQLELSCDRLFDQGAETGREGFYIQEKWYRLGLIWNTPLWSGIFLPLYSNVTAYFSALVQCSYIFQIMPTSSLTKSQAFRLLFLVFLLLSDDQL